CCENLLERANGDDQRERLLCPCVRNRVGSQRRHASSFSGNERAKRLWLISSDNNWAIIISSVSWEREALLPSTWANTNTWSDKPPSKSCMCRSPPPAR